MPLGLKNNIINQKGTPAFYSDIFANRPTYGYAGRVFISTDTGAIYEDTGTAWTLIADAGAGTTGTLEQVTTNGKTTTQGISITGSTLNFDASGVSANPITMIYNTSVNRLLTPVVRLYGNTSIASNYVELFGTNATSNRTVNFPDASGVVGLSAAALTNGSVVFAGAGGVLSQDNTNFFWDNTNKYLGIGNTGTPSAPLDIHNGTVGQLIQLNATSTNNSNIAFLNGSVGKWRIGNVYNAGANDFNIYNIGTALNAISINSTTSNVTFNGGLRTTGTADQQLWVYGTSPSLRLYDSATSPTINGFVGMSSAANNFILGSASGDMCIGTSTAGKIYIGSGTTTVSPALTILSSGYVGIGITSPTFPLQVVISSTSVGAAYIEQSAAGNGLAVTSSGNDGSHYIANFRSTGVDRLRILDNGNTLIGTTTDNGGKLQVNGGIYSYGTNSTYLYTDQTSGVNWQLYANSSTCRFYNNASGNVVSIAQATGIYTPTSDINRKKDFELSEIGLNAILGLKPTLFRMKEENDTNKHLGFIAQQVKEFIPQAYVEEKDFIGLSDRPIIAALVKAIQELNDKLVKNNIN